MDYVSDTLKRAMFDVIKTSDVLHICAGIASPERLKSVSLGTAKPRFLLEGMDLHVLPITDGVVQMGGQATHWALVRGGELLASAPLSSPSSVQSGLAFTLNRFVISF